MINAILNKTAIKNNLIGFYISRFFETKMCAMTRKCYQIFRQIIFFISVNMMNYFAFFKITADKFFYNQPMFFYSTARIFHGMTECGSGYVPINFNGKASGFFKSAYALFLSCREGTLLTPHGIFFTHKRNTHLRFFYSQSFPKHGFALTLPHFQRSDISSFFHIPSLSHYMISAYKKQGGIT